MNGTGKVSRTLSPFNLDLLLWFFPSSTKKKVKIVWQFFDNFYKKKTTENDSFLGLKLSHQVQKYNVFIDTFFYTRDTVPFYPIFPGIYSNNCWHGPRTAVEFIGQFSELKLVRRRGDILNIVSPHSLLTHWYNKFKL